MLHISVPGYKELHLEHLVLDYNGTLAIDGVPISEVLDRLRELSQLLQVHVVTADTFGHVRTYIQAPAMTIHVLDNAAQDEQKADYVAQIGAEQTVAIGNGYNDYLMLHNAALGIAVIQTEGASVITLTHADLVFTDILDALDCLQHSKRVIASLRR